MPPYDWSGNPIKLVPVNVYTSGLIFKDVMFATGLYHVDNKPIFHILVIIIGRIPSGIMSLYTDCVIGLEFAGRRVDTGERVMGFVESRAFATNVYPCRDLLTTIPDHWSMSDAVTILSTYCTLWYGLIKKGGLQRGLSLNCFNDSKRGVYNFGDPHPKPQTIRPQAYRASAHGP